MNNQEILNSLNEKIKAAEEALLYLNQTKAGLERVIAMSTKTPAEEAWKKYWGEYPNNPNEQLWKVFQTGYNDAYYNNAHKEPEENEWKNVALEFGKKLPTILPYNYDELSPNAWYRWVVFTYDKYMEQRDKECGYTPKSQEEVKKLQEKEWTYKVTDEKGETNPYKSYMNSVTTLHQELFDYGFTDSQIEDIILIVNRFLPEPIKETCGMKDWDSAWTIGYNNYRDTLMERLK